MELVVRRRRGLTKRVSAPARILMLARQPFFESRGRPFREYHCIKALGELGYRIDLVRPPGPDRP